MCITSYGRVARRATFALTLLLVLPMPRIAPAAGVEGDIPADKALPTGQSDTLENVGPSDEESAAATRKKRAPKPTVDSTRPSVARVPTSQAKPLPPSEQEARLTELKHGLAGPGGLIYLSDLQEFVESWPENSQARMWLIRALIQSGDAGAALNAIGAPGQWREADWQVGFWKANAHLLGGELDLALAESEHALNQENRSPEIWVQRAVLEQETGNHGGAVQLLRIALKLDSDHAMALLNLGYSLEHLARPADALSAYRHFITTSEHPGSALRQQVLERIQRLSEVTRQAAYTVSPVRQPTSGMRHNNPSIAR